MPTDPANGQAPAERRTVLVLVAILVLFSVPDLLSPPITPTGLRQVQTFSQAVNFVAGGFSPHAMTLDIDGPNPFRVVHEFPLYQGLAGLLCAGFGASVFWGKLISLIATSVALWLAFRLARQKWGASPAWRAGLMVATCPVVLLVSASFQPDALAMALCAWSGCELARWRHDPTFGRWLVFLVWFTLAALAKFTVIVPFLPLLAWAVFSRGGTWRMLRVSEWIAAVVLFLMPFVAWNLYRGTVIDPRYLVVEREMFMIGDLNRFLVAGYYAKAGFILGAMVLCGVGIPLVLLGFRGLDAAGWALIAGLPFYFFILPTSATQTYYAFPLVPALALLAGRGLLLLEHAVPERWRNGLRATVVIGWITGFAIAAPYTLRHDDISLTAAHAAREVSAKGDLIFVMNMHDRGVAIGSFNPTIITLAERRGWNIDFRSTDPAQIREQIESRRRDGARWVVATWYSPDLEPWFTPFLPAAFARQPRFGGAAVDGREIVEQLAQHYPVAARGPNHAVLRLP
jgi:hypothetical protein